MMPSRSSAWIDCEAVRRLVVGALLDDEPVVSLEELDALAWRAAAGPHPEP
jgi:hypothetical protein